jgi:TolB-like protein
MIGKTLGRYRVLEKIGRELGVSYILAGRCRREGRRILISV